MAVRTTLRSVRKIINVQTLIVTTLAVVSTHLCRINGLTAEFPLTLIGIAVVFPLVFSISGAYKRREAALDEYGSMKAHGRAIFFASRDWIDSPEKQAEAKDVLAGGEVSRCNQYVSKMLIAFENVKHIYQYRTPRTLRAYSQFFIYILPIIYGPYFAWLSQEYAANLEFVMPILFSVALVSLENIQEHLEDPFDLVGEDDVIINVEKFIARLGA